MQGLINILREELAYVYHRFYVKHKWMNFKNSLGFQTFKDQLWNATKAYNWLNSNTHKQETKVMDKETYHYLMRPDPGE